MNARCVAAAVIALVVANPPGVSAQRADTTCSTFTVYHGGSLAGRDSLAAIDTLIRLDIRDRTWQRDSVGVGVAFGASGTAGSRRAPWRTCVGVSALLGHVAADLHNVHARIHFRVDPAALDSIGRTSTSSAAPPRR